MSAASLPAPRPRSWGPVLLLALGLALAGLFVGLGLLLANVWFIYPTARMVSLLQITRLRQDNALLATTEYVTSDPVDKVVGFWASPAQPLCVPPDPGQPATCNQTVVDLGRLSVERYTNIAAGPYGSSYIRQIVKLTIKP